MHDWLDRTEYPFMSRTWEVDAGQMHYVDEGTGHPVVFVHGVPTWSFNFRYLIKALSPKHRCVAMDHLGFGLSTKPIDWSYAPEALAANVATLIDGLSLRDITLVVHDWGGPLGLAYAINNPTNVKRLVIINTWLWSVRGDWQAELPARLLASPLYHFLEDRFNFTARMFVPMVMGDQSKLTPAIHRHYIEPLRSRNERKGCWALVQGILHASPWIGSLWDRRESLQTIPTVIIWGLKDRAFTRRDLDRWKSLFPHAQTHTYAHVGHFPQEEIPRDVSEIIGQFLQM